MSDPNKLPVPPQAPAAQESQPPQTAPQTAPQAAAQPERKLKRVLVIDDDDKILASLKRILSRVANEVVTAMTCTDGIAQLEKPEHGIEFVLSDYSTPGNKGGNDVYDAAQAQGIPCGVVTGWHAEFVRTDVPMIHKPFTPEEVKDFIRRLLLAQSAPAEVPAEVPVATPAVPTDDTEQ